MNRAILNKLPSDLARNLEKLPGNVLDSLEEIRLKVGMPILIYSGGKEYQVGTGKEALTNQNMLQNVFSAILNHSVYAYQDELANGYVTIEGGHRAGICGKVVTENGMVKTIKDVSSINIRRSKEIIGVSDPYMKYLFQKDRTFYNTVLVSPPKCGKTTLLRDIIRNISKRGLKVGVVDERSEITGMHGGVPSYDLGVRTDVLDACPKEKGMIMLIRSMSPDVIATDEIGKAEDIYAIESAICAGIQLITTIHGKDYHDLCHSAIGTFVESGVFQRIIYLTNQPHTGYISDITDAKNRSLVT